MEVEINLDSLMTKCRFCLSDLKKDKKLIDNALKSKFLELTGISLKKSKIYSKYVCSVCHQHFEFSYHFINKLIEQQKHCNLLEDNLEAESSSQVKMEFEEGLEIEEEGMEISKVEYLDECQEYIENIEEYEEYSIVAEEEDPKKAAASLSASINKGRNMPDKNHVVACSECRERFRKIDYEDHIKVAHPHMNGIYVCGICLHSFPYKSRLVRHLPTHYKQNDEFSCDYCPKSFPLEGLLSDHITKVHTEKQPKPKKLYECLHCDKVFKSQGGLGDHEKTIHYGDRNFPCNYPGCTMIATNRQQLQIHRQHHRNEEHLCPYEQCGKVFLSMTQLKKHLYHHEKPYRCEPCNKGFASNAKLVYHTRIVHENIFEVCELCDKNFTHKESLNQHIAVVHNNFKIFCEVPGCTSSFGRKQHLTRHLLKLHPELTAEERDEMGARAKSVKIQDADYLVADKTIEIEFTTENN